MRTLKFVLFLLLLPLVCACTSDDFTIEGEFKGLGTQNVRITYVGDNGVVTEVLAADKDRFTFAGRSSRLMVVDVTDAQGTLLARAAACNGDRVTMKGDSKHPELVTVDGNPANEQWTTFRTSHAALYASLPSAELDHTIEQWAKEHPDDVTSTLMLLYDHSAILTGGTRLALLTSISPEARPEHLITAFETLANYYTRNASTTLHTLTLCGTSGDYELLTLDGHRAVVYCWSATGSDSAACATACRELADRGVLVADVLLDADTTDWARKRAATGNKAHHYWSPTGPMNATLKPLRIAAVPWFIVTDSVGRITYRGASLDEALKAVP